jgi:hypothetical protein
MNKKVLVSIVLLTFVTVGAAFAQSLTGIWKSPSGNVFSYYDDKAVFTEINNNGWKEVEKRGYIGIGSPATRNLRSTGNLTWSGQDLTYNTRTYVTSWTNVTLTLNPNGLTFEQTTSGSSGKQTYTKVSGFELTGIWKSPSGNVFSYYDDKAVFVDINNSGWKEVEKSGNIGIGSLATRNLRSTGNLTWSGQDLTYNTRTYATSWVNVTVTLNPNGLTFEQTTSSGKDTYTRIGAASAPAPAVNTSLNGWWIRGDGLTIYIDGNTGYFLYPGTEPRWQDAQTKGYVKTNDIKLRNIRSTGNLTWTMQELAVKYNSRSPNVATGVDWDNSTYTMSADGKTLSENGRVVWTRTPAFQ